MAFLLLNGWVVSMKTVESAEVNPRGLRLCGPILKEYKVATCFSGLASYSHSCDSAISVFSTLRKTYLIPLETKRKTMA